MSLFECGIMEIEKIGAVLSRKKLKVPISEKEMKDNRLSIHINKPVEEVFAYSLASENVPKWITAIEQEIPSELPVGLGTKLKNIGVGSDVWNEYEIIDFESPTTFTLKRLNGDYYVKYTCKPEGSGTNFEYYEWADGELEDPMDISALRKLKALLESPTNNSGGRDTAL